MQSCNSSPILCVRVKLSAPVGRDVVRMGQENETVHGARPPSILDIDGGGQGIERKSFGARVTIPKQQKTIAGFANKFGISGDLIPNLLRREFFFVGHYRNNFSTGFDQEPKKVLAVNCHRHSLLIVYYPHGSTSSLTFRTHQQSGQRRPGLSRGKQGCLCLRIKPSACHSHYLIRHSSRPVGQILPCLLSP